MQVAANNILVKTSRDITAGIRNASCNRGWLQVFTHIVCGAFTVTSFILILIVAFNTTKTKPNFAESRCQLSGCRVICHGAPFYDEYEDDIVLGVMAAEVNCHRVFLTLTEPRFTDESLPQNWLSRLRPVVVEIGIIGGNLHHIPQNAFSVAFARNMKLLLLEEITITSWSQHALLGLANLENIFIKKCNIIDMQDNFLSAVSQSLSTLTVVESGYWNPENLTGSSQLFSFPMLTWVDLSSNDFGANLGNASFTRLRHCKSLYLASNRISYIEPGTFDNLIELEYLNLNNNFLNRLEPGLFNVMTSFSTPKVRLNLVENWWHCDCSDRELRRITALAILLVDPICNSPESVRGKTFHEFVAYCKQSEPKQIVTVDMQSRTVENEESSIEKFTCVSKTSSDSVSNVVSPYHNYQCSVNVLNSLSQGNSTMIDYTTSKDSLWVKPVIILIGENFTMVELSLSRTEGHGLIWYRHSCANQVFCVNVLPDTIRLYNMDMYNEYTFCPVDLKSGAVESSHCIDVSSNNTSNSSFKTRLIILPLIALASLFFGAITLYMLIRKYPFLLKGSKRLLFVKHKTVDALVLPPKVPLRGVQSNSFLHNSKDIPDIPTSLRVHHDFMRSGSVRSCHSIAPSYISALHPTEEQLADWRLKHANERFDSHYATVSIISSAVSVSLSSNSDHLYYSIEEDSPIVSISDPFSQNLEYEPFSVS